jgi:hypothetical protein
MGAADETLKIEWDRIPGTVSFPMCRVAVGRVDGDSLDSLMTFGADGAMYWRRDPDAAFHEPQVVAGGVNSVSFVDWDHDGDDEFAVVDAGEVSILQAPGDTPIPLGSVADEYVVAIGDLMGDDNLDVAVEEGRQEDGRTLRWYRGTETGFVEEEPFVVPDGVFAWGRGDWDGDGYIEPVYVGSSEAFVVEPGEPPTPWETDFELGDRIHSVDLDGDGVIEFVGLTGIALDDNDEYVGQDRMEIHRPSGRETLEIPPAYNLVPGDFDGVGGDEMLLQGSSRSLVVAYENGAPLIVFVDLDIHWWNPLYGAHLDGDGITDLVLSSDGEPMADSCSAYIYRTGLRTGDGM